MTDFVAAAGLPTPNPPVNPETQPFWDAAADGRLLLKRCADCQAVIWYPRAICPTCHGIDTTWFDASGRGVIYSYAVVHRGEGSYANATPFVLAYVELLEGPRIITNIVDADPDTLAIDQPVSVVFHATSSGTALPRFRPDRSPTRGDSPARQPRTS